MLRPGEDITEGSMIRYAERDVSTPANDFDKLPRLESDGKIHEYFIRVARDFTVSESVTKSNPVGIDIDGKISRALRTWATDATSIPSNFGGLVKVTSIGPSKWVVIYSYTPSTVSLRAVVCTIDSNSHSITFGTPVDVTTTLETADSADVCRLDTDKFLVAYTEDGVNDVMVVAATVSGTTITLGTGQNVSVGSYVTLSCCQLATNKFALYAQNSGTTANFHGFGSVSGTTITITASSTTAITNFTTTADSMVEMIKIATDKFAMVNGANGYAVVCTTVGTTYTVGTAVAMFTPTSGAREKTSIIDGGTDVFYVRAGTVMRRATVSGTTISTSGATVSITNDAGGKFVRKSGTIYEIHNNSTAAASGLYKISWSGTATVREQVQTFTNAVIDAFPSSDETRFLAIGASGAAYHLDGMSDNLSGFPVATTTAGGTAKIQFVGTATGLVNLIPGASYTGTNGAWTLSPGQRNVAISSSEMLVS